MLKTPTVLIYFHVLIWNIQTVFTFKMWFLLKTNMILSVNAAYLCVDASLIWHVVKRKWKRQMTKVWTVFTWVFQLCQLKHKKIITGTTYSLSHIMRHRWRCHQSSSSSSVKLFSVIDTWIMCLMVWYWVIYESNSSTSSSLWFDQIEEMSRMSFFFITKSSLSFLCLLSPLSSPLCLLQWVWRGPPWPSSPPPQRSCSRAVPHWCVWPAGASPQPGGWAGRWGAAAPPQGCHTARRPWGVTATTAGAAPWASLQTSGGRRAQWAVRPVWMDRALSLKAWTLTAAQSRASATRPVWKWCCCFDTDLHQATHLLSSHISHTFTALCSVF